MTGAMAEQPDRLNLRARRRQNCYGAPPRCRLASSVALVANHFTSISIGSSSSRLLGVYYSSAVDFGVFALIGYFARSW